MPEEPQRAHQRVAEGGVPQVADVRRLVRVDGRVLDDHLLARGPARRPDAVRQAVGEVRRPLEVHVQVAVRGAFDAGHAGDGPERRGDLLADDLRRLAQAPGEFERHGDREIAHPAVGRDGHGHLRHLGRREAVRLRNGGRHSGAKVFLGRQNHDVGIRCSLTRLLTSIYDWRPACAASRSRAARSARTTSPAVLTLSSSSPSGSNVAISSGPSSRTRTSASRSTTFRAPCSMRHPEGAGAGRRVVRAQRLVAVAPARDRDVRLLPGFDDPGQERRRDERHVTGEHQHGPGGVGERRVDAAHAAAARHGVNQHGHAGVGELLRRVRDDDDAGHQALEHVELARQNGPPADDDSALVASAEAPGAAAGENGCSLHVAARGSGWKHGTLAEK